MENKRIEDADFSQTGYSYTLSLIAGNTSRSSSTA